MWLKRNLFSPKIKAMPHATTKSNQHIKEIIELIDSINKISEENAFRSLPSINAPRLAIYTGPAPDYIAEFRKGRLKLNQLCDYAGCDLRIYELPDSPLTPEEVARSMAYGMLSVEDGLDFFAASTIDTEKAGRIIAVHQSNAGPKGLDALQSLGSPDISALCGAILATRMAKLPILLEGAGAYAAYLVLANHCPHIGQHCALTGYKETNELPYFPHPYPDYDGHLAGTASACMIPILRNSLILDQKTGT